MKTILACTQYDARLTATRDLGWTDLTGVTFTSSMKRTGDRAGTLYLGFMWIYAYDKHLIDEWQGDVIHVWAKHQKRLLI